MENTHKNVFGAYAGSLVAQNFGESVDGHGFLVWDFANKTVKEVAVENPYSMHNIYLKKGTDYDKLDWVQIPATAYTKIMVHWEDYTSAMTRENQLKITRYLKERFQAVEIRFKRKPIDKETEKVAVNDLRLDNIGDAVVQQDIIRDYLRTTHHTDDTITKILEIDDTISRRLSSKGLGQGGRYDWRLLNLDIDNFKSFGDGVALDWDGKNGIWQIQGRNQQGKSSVYEAFMYLAFGRTTDVRGREKHSDNRYINFKRDEDFAQVSGVFDINNGLYRLTRRTTREWKRGGKAGSSADSIKSVPTVLSFHRLDTNLQPIEDESVDKRKETEKIIVDALGNYEDFMRTSFISSSTLNSLLVMDYAQFLDALLRDIGLDIFEKKLEEFKVWRKEVFSKLPRHVVDVISEEGLIVRSNEEISNAHKEIQRLTTELKECNTRLKKGRAYKDEQLKKLTPVDAALSTMSKEFIQNEINILFSEKEQKEREILTFLERIAELANEFDETLYQELKNRENEIMVGIQDKKLAIQTTRNEQERVQTKMGRELGDLELLNRKLCAIPKQEAKEMELFKRNTHLIAQEIQQLQDSTHCVTCKREKDESTVAAIGIAIEEKLKSIDLVQDDINSVIDKYLLERQEIADEMGDVEKRVDLLKPMIAGFDEKVKAIKEEQAHLEIDLTAVGMGLKAQDIIRQELVKRQQLEAKMAIVPVQLSNIDLQVEAAKKKFHEFVRMEKTLVENEKITAVIVKTDERIEELEAMLRKAGNEITQLEKLEIPQLEGLITNATSRITLYREQEQRDYVHKLYEECFHRDGIPATILSKSLHFINAELSELLEDVPFRIYIDEDFAFKMTLNDYPGHVMNVISGCGMERTFASLVLRLAMRLLNNKSVGNMLLLDEVMGCLDPDYFQIFLNLLNKSKTRIEKIVIVEHAYSEILQSDYQIEIEQSDDGTSCLSLSD